MWRYGVFLQKKHERGYGKGEEEGRGWVGYDERGMKGVEEAVDSTESVELISDF